MKKLDRLTEASPAVRENREKINEIIKILGKRGSFTPPDPKQVEDYARFYATQKPGINSNIDGEKFCDSYAKKGWMIGKSKMRDWKAAVRLCVRDGWAQRIPSDIARDTKKLRDKAYADAQEQRIREDFTGRILNKNITKAQLDKFCRDRPDVAWLVFELRPDIYENAK